MSARFCSKNEVRSPDQGMYMSSVWGAVAMLCSTPTCVWSPPLSSCSVMLPSSRRSRPSFAASARTVTVVSPRSPLAGPTTSNSSPVVVSDHGPLDETVNDASEPASERSTTLATLLSRRCRSPSSLLQPKAAAAVSTSSSRRRAIICRCGVSDC